MVWNRLLEMSKTKKPADEPVIEDEADDVEEEFVVEKVVDTRMRSGKKEYLLKWKGYPEWVGCWIEFRLDLVRNWLIP